MARRPRPASSLRTIASKPVAPEGRPSQGAQRRRSVRPVKVRSARNPRSERRRIAYHVPFFEESPAWPQVDIAPPPVSLPERPVNALAAHAHPHVGDIPVHTGPKNSPRRMKSEPGISERPSVVRVGTRTERAQGLRRYAHRSSSGTDAGPTATRIGVQAGGTRGPRLYTHRNPNRASAISESLHASMHPQRPHCPYPHAPTRRAGIVANALAAHNIEPEHAVETWMIRAIGVQNNLIVKRPGSQYDRRVGL